MKLKYSLFSLAAIPLLATGCSQQPAQSQQNSAQTPSASQAQNPVIMASGTTGSTMQPTTTSPSAMPKASTNIKLKPKVITPTPAPTPTPTTPAPAPTPSSGYYNYPNSSPTPPDAGGGASY